MTIVGSGAPRRLQEAPRRLQQAPKRPSDGSKSAPRGLMTAPREFQEGSRRPQDHSKRPQDGSKSAPRGLGTLQETPRAPQKVSRRLRKAQDSSESLQDACIPSKSDYKRLGEVFPCRVRGGVNPSPKGCKGRKEERRKDKRKQKKERSPEI